MAALLPVKTNHTQRDAKTIGDLKNMSFVDLSPDFQFEIPTFLESSGHNSGEYDVMLVQDILPLSEIKVEFRPSLGVTSNVVATFFAEEVDQGFTKDELHAKVQSFYDGCQKTIGAISKPLTGISFSKKKMLWLAHNY